MVNQQQKNIDKAYDDTEHTFGAVQAAANGEVVISVEALTKNYGTKHENVKVLDDITFSVKRGEFVVLTGQSGSGKSTLLQLIGAIDTPTSGNIVINNTSLRSMNDRQLAKYRGENIGFVFQFFYLQPFLTVRQNIELPGMFVPGSRSERKRRAQQLAEMVGLNDQLNRLPHQLSGGQIQRAAIARALLNKPNILLADEPTGNLDSRNSESVIQLFEKVRDEFNVTVFVVTHDQEIAKRADRILTIKDGKIQ